MSETETLPKLTKPQMARLVEIGLDKEALTCLAEKHPRTNEALDAMGLIERYQRRTMKWVRLTTKGTRILAGIPGPEFDRFRESLKREKVDG